MKLKWWHALILGVLLLLILLLILNALRIKDGPVPYTLPDPVQEANPDVPISGMKEVVHLPINKKRKHIISFFNRESDCETAPIVLEGECTVSGGTNHKVFKKVNRICVDCMWYVMRNEQQASRSS